MYRVSAYITIFALCLLGGTLIAVFWANFAPESYQDLVELRLIDNFIVGYPNPDATGLSGRTLTLQYLTNNLLLALFFFLVGKELWEALVHRLGPFRGPQALVPLAATLGGMLVPVVIYLAIAATTRGSERADLLPGWAVPAASDLALAYLVGRSVFGGKHPALRFLMLVAILSEVLGLILLGLVQLSGPFRPLWLLLPVLAPLLAWGLFDRLPRHLDRGDVREPRIRRLRRALGPAPWVIAGLLSWYGVQQAGLHPALGLLPMVPAIPQADRSYGFFAEAEEFLTDMLNRLAHLLVTPVAVGLFLYGLTSGGAVFAAYAPASTVSFFALMPGKPVGIAGAAMIAARISGTGLPAGVSRSDLLLLALIAAIGFTVPLLTANATLPGGAVQEAAKLGILCSLVAAPLALLLARILRLGRWKRPPSA